MRSIKTTLWISLLVLCGSILHAKVPGERVFLNQGDKSAVNPVYVGSMSATLIYSPSTRGDERGVQFWNPSPNFKLHIASFSVIVVSSNSHTYELDVSTNPNSSVNLTGGATIYGMYEAGSSSYTIKPLRKYQP